MRTIRVFVVDDEPLARRKLAALIAEVPWVVPVGEAADGAAAVEAIARLRPEVVFLDIRMPELSGLQVVDKLAALEPVPAVVFTTAYDQYAVAAFELDAVDYLLKPFGRRRFMMALERARQIVEMRQGTAVLERARGLLDAGATTVNRKRIFARDGSAIVPVIVDEIERIEAQDDYVLIHARTRQYLVSLRIRDLEAWLPDPPFLRVHRSHIVNFDYVERLVGLDGARLEVRMHSGDRVPVSRARSQQIRRQSR
jgi:two-component system LytT family response regulator